jgi:hypothetical protein
MKSIYSLCLLATSLIVGAALSSCQDEDFDVSTEVLKERAFASSFEKEFGTPSDDQPWDFYAQKMQALFGGQTRADIDDGVIKITTGLEQSDADIALFKQMMGNDVAQSLPEHYNNKEKGTVGATLVSAGGEFTLSCINYGGGLETGTAESEYHYTDYDFELGIGYYTANGGTVEYPLFGPTTNTVNKYEYDFGNPKFAAKIYLPAKTRFYFYITYNTKKIAEGGYFDVPLTPEYNIPVTQEIYDQLTQNDGFKIQIWNSNLSKISITSGGVDKIVIDNESHTGYYEREFSSDVLSGIAVGDKITILSSGAEGACGTLQIHTQPGWKPLGASFDNVKSYKFYSDRTPESDYQGDTDHPIDYPIANYTGAANVFYNIDHISTFGEEQIMFVGIEDLWEDIRLADATSSQIWPDFDFNDIVLVIQGSVPIAASKRFFAEDLESFDYDYNDVVFDLENTGIVLRAVGGTLPVYLKVTCKPEGYTEGGALTEITTGELHELMYDQQLAATKANFSHDDLTYVDEGGQTFYRPINVARTDVGVKLDPVRILTWTTAANNKLTDDEVTRFANERLPDGTAKFGDVKLLVRPEYVDPTSTPAEAPTNIDELIKEGTIKIVSYRPNGGPAAIWWGSTEIQWMREFKKITKGYPLFYQDNWYNTVVSGAAYSTNVYIHTDDPIHPTTE